MIPATGHLESSLHLSCQTNLSLGRSHHPCGALVASSIAVMSHDSALRRLDQGLAIRPDRQARGFDQIAGVRLGRGLTSPARRTLVEGECETVFMCVGLAPAGPLLTIGSRLPGPSSRLPWRQARRTSRRQVACSSEHRGTCARVVLRALFGRPPALASDRSGAPGSAFFRQQMRRDQPPDQPVSLDGAPDVLVEVEP